MFGMWGLSEDSRQCGLGISRSQLSWSSFPLGSQVAGPPSLRDLLPLSRKTFQVRGQWLEARELRLLIGDFLGNAPAEKTSLSQEIQSTQLPEPTQVTPHLLASTGAKAVCPNPSLAAAVPTPLSSQS